MQRIILEDLKIYAYHGVHEVENLVGQWYTIRLELKGDFSAALEKDDLWGTIDYSVVGTLVQEEMKQSSKLIEHVAGRIVARLQESFEKLEGGLLKISKLNPPVKADLGAVSFELSF